MPKLHADSILLNGTIWCGFDEGTVEALAIWQGKVLVTGSKDEVLAYNGPRTSPVDLKGGFATPGLNDAHLHLIATGGGSTLDRCNAAGCAEPSKLAARYKREGQELTARRLDQGTRVRSD